MAHKETQKKVSRECAVSGDGGEDLVTYRQKEGIPGMQLALNRTWYATRSASATPLGTRQGQGEARELALAVARTSTSLSY